MGGGVAVLGAGGFVGARLLEMAVLGDRTDIVPVVRSFRSVARSAQLAVPHRVADTSRHESLLRALDGCDVVVNLTAGKPHEILPGTENIYRAARAAGARLLIHISSAMVFGDLDRPDLPDDAPPRLDQWKPYAREKGRAENFLRERMAGDGQVAIVVLRPSLVWGPSSQWVLGPASELVRGAAYLRGDGAGICNLMYVDDLVRSIDAVVTHGAAPSGFFNVADDIVPTWRDYYMALAEGLGIDAATIHSVPEDGYRPGLRERLEPIRDHPAYLWLKERISLETRTDLKARLGPGHERKTLPGAAARPLVTRTMWEVQATRYPLPTTKFRATFGTPNRVSFRSGIAASLAWLRFIGLGDREPILHAARTGVLAATREH
jgi:nucleoside-diphosphate-sugar epimerase